MQRQPMTDEALRQMCPAAFADHPHSSVTDKYTFIPTTTLLGAMRENGWQPVYARQNGVIKEDRRGFQPHIIKFWHKDVDYKNFSRVGDSRLELTMVNSHDRTARYKLHGGVFRLVC